MDKYCECHERLMYYHPGQGRYRCIVKLRQYARSDKAKEASLRAKTKRESLGTCFYGLHENDTPEFKSCSNCRTKYTKARVKKMVTRVEKGFCANCGTNSFQELVGPRNIRGAWCEECLRDARISYLEKAIVRDSNKVQEIELLLKEVAKCN